MKRLVERLGGGIIVAATAAITTLVVVACATGTATTGGDLGEGGLEGDASRDVNVVPLPKDGAPPEDTGTTPGDDSGSCGQKIVINEVMSDGPGGSEFVELYNPSTCAVPLGNWSLKYRSSSDTAGGAGVAKFAAGESIAAKGFLVIGTASFAGAKNVTLVTGLGNTGGQLGLLDDTGATVDAVGYGSSTAGAYTEGAAALLPATNGSIGRGPNGVDSENNKTDFKAYGTPSPGIANP